MFLTVLSIIILPGGPFGSVGARAAPIEDDVQGIPWTGEPGITETVAEIMAREQLRAQSPGAAGLPPMQIKARLMAPPKIHGDLSAPEVSAWPVSDSSRARGAESLPHDPQTVGTSFVGAQLSESTFIPPDSMGAVGPSQVLIAANGRIKVFDKNGVLGGLNTDTDSFFTSVGGITNGTSDPHVRYDRLSGRWFVTIIDVATSPNNILIAVSSGSTITNTSSFTFFKFQQDLVGPTPNADTGSFADYDTLGVDKFALYVGVNMFNAAGTAFLGTTGFVINKANLLANTLTVTAFRQLAGNTCPSAGVYTPQGVHNDDPQATEGYFIGVDICLFSKLVLRRVSNPGGTPSISGNLALTVPTTILPILQRHAGAAANRRLDSLDDRLFGASIHTNALTGARTLWTAHNIEVNSSGVGAAGGGRNGSRWYEIGTLTTTPMLVQSGTLFDSATTNPLGFWIPSVAMSGQGHMALGSSRASPVEFAGIAVAGRLRTDSLGTIQAPTLAQSSTFAYNVEPVDGQRWGDYSQVAVDPSDNQTLWTFQEYTTATNSWGVRAIQLKAPPPATPAIASPSTVAAGQPTVDVTIDGMALSGSEFFDPGPDTGGPGFLNHIAASISGGVTVNAVTVVTPTRVTLNISTVGATAGAKDVTITNPDGQSTTGAGLLAVSAAPTHVAVVAPASATAGSAFSVTVTARDASNNTATGYAGTVHFTSGDGAATLPANATLTSGTGTFSATLRTSGNQTITATDTVTASITGTSNIILVMNLPTQLTALGPAKIWVGPGHPRFAIKFDLSAEVYVDNTLVGSGQVNSMSVGFGTTYKGARLASIPLALTSGPADVPNGSALKVRVLVRNACSGSTKSSGIARFWFNGKAVDTGFKRDTASRFGATIEGATSDYFQRDGFVLNRTAGTAHMSVDAAVGAQCGPFVPFGTWSITLP